MKLNEFEKIAKMLAKEHRITIEAGSSWAANIKDKRVFYRKEDIYNLSEDHILGLILHEIAHIHYTSDVPMPALNKELTHSTLNMIEDISIEHIISFDYPNAGEILESTKTEVLDTLLKLLPKLKESVYEKGLLFAAARFEGRGFANGITPYEKLGEKIAEIMIRRKDEIYGRKHTSELMPLVKEITDLMVKEAGEPTDDQKRSMMQSGMHGKAHDESMQQGSKQQMIDALKAAKGWKPGPAINNDLEFIDAISDQSAIIGKRLRTILKRNNAMEFGGRYRSGKLKTKSLVRVKVLKDRRPFARRIIKSNQSYAFAIASDVSGSMFEDSTQRVKSPASYALTSMHMVGEALRLAGISRSMIIFADRARVCAPMSKAQITFQQLGDQNLMNEAGGGTSIDRGMLACIEQLETVRAERKIMIIITDGSSDVNAMKEMHKQAVAKGIEPLGITIGNDIRSMQETFGKSKNRIIANTKDNARIGEAFIDILRESVKKSQ